MFIWPQKYIIFKTKVQINSVIFQVGDFYLIEKVKFRGHTIYHSTPLGELSSMVPKLCPGLWRLESYGLMKIKKVKGPPYGSKVGKKFENFFSQFIAQSTRFDERSSNLPSDSHKNQK